MSDVPLPSKESTPQQTGNSGPVVWVFASGPVDDPLRDVRGLPRPDVVIAADGGSTLAARLGLDPSLIVGDLDSSDPAVVADFEARGVEVRRYEHHTKVETDTELAVFAALGWQPSELILLGALGGRLDHSLANILLLTNPLLAGTRVRIVGSDEEVFIAREGEWNEVQGESGDTVSLLPMGGPATGIRLEGFEYPLDDETLTEGVARGVSNRLTSRVGRLWLEAGTLLVVHTRQWV